MKVSFTKTKSNETFYISRSFINQSGKCTSKNHLRLGTLTELSSSLGTDRDGVLLWAKEQARIETEKFNKENEAVSISFSPSLLIEKEKSRFFNSGYLFLQSLYSDLRFDNIIRNIKARHDYEYNLDSILSDLIYSRILHPSSKKSSYVFAQSLLEQPKYQLHDLYRALSVLAQESDYIQSEVYRNSNFIHKRN
ncbi:MAG: transposase, partial [Longicatena sp.]